MQKKNSNELDSCDEKHFGNTQIVIMDEEAFSAYLLMQQAKQAEVMLAAAAAAETAMAAASSKGNDGATAVATIAVAAAGKDRIGPPVRLSYTVMPQINSSIQS